MFNMYFLMFFGFCFVGIPNVFAGCNCIQDDESTQIMKLINHNKSGYNKARSEIIRLFDSRKKLSSEDQALLREDIKHRPKILKEDKDFLRKAVEKRNKETLKSLNKNNKYPKLRGSNTKTNNRHEILVFLSLSMPIESIKNIMTNYKSHNARFLLRGFKDNSLIKTIKLFEGVIKSTNVGLEIDPMAFKKYEIKKVPTFVVRDVNEKDSFDKLSGSVSPKFLLDTVRAKGDVGGGLDV